MLTKIILAILYSCLTINVYSQNTNILEENKLFSYQKMLQLDGPGNKKIMLPHKGKKMIVDFFSSYCVVCFRMIPKMDTLQKKYKNDINILLVGKDDRKIRSIYHRFSERLKLKLSVAFDSAIFSKFKIDLVPSYVWIDENGIVKAITGVEEMTDENVRLFINNKDISRSQNEQLQEFNPDHLLFVNGNGGNDGNIQYRSLLTEWTQNLPFYIPPSLKENPETDKFQAVGVTFSDLYRYAYFGIVNWDTQHPYSGKVFPFPLVKNSKGNASIPLESEKRYCYSLYKSNSKLSDAFIRNHLVKDLEFYFGYQARLVGCTVPCWKLSITNENLLTPSGRNKAYVKNDAAGFTIFNHPISKILQIIHQYNPLEVPIIDCTGINYNIDINIDASMEDMNDIAKSLAPFGIKLTKGEVIMQAIILEEAK